MHKSNKTCFVSVLFLVVILAIGLSGCSEAEQNVGKMVENTSTSFPSLTVTIAPTQTDTAASTLEPTQTNTSTPTETEVVVNSMPTCATADLIYVERDMKQTDSWEFAPGDINFIPEVGWEFIDMADNEYALSISLNNEKGSSFEVWYVPSGFSEGFSYTVRVPQNAIVHLNFRSDTDNPERTKEVVEYVPTINSFVYRDCTGVSGCMHTNFVYTLNFLSTGEVTISFGRLDRRGGCDLQYLQAVKENYAYTLPNGESYYLDKCNRTGEVIKIE